jgi:O-antigen ligase
MGTAFLYLVARSKHRVRNLILVGIAVVPLLIFSPSSPLHRFLHPDYSDRESTENHITAWKAGIRMIGTHPILGIGLGNFKPMMHLYVPPGTAWSTIAHNTFLEVAAELGLPALGIFAGILVFTYRSLGKAGRRARLAGDRVMYLATVGLQAGFVGYLVGACTISAEYTKLFWLVIFLSMCLPHVLRVRRIPVTLPSPSLTGVM